ncbi:MAG: hypothetical protein IJI45_18770, partial [Anaerolineaceae bacterium]|nr:hypothetical protein [Anaerolineaceae bacterium]
VGGLTLIDGQVDITSGNIGVSGGLDVRGGELTVNAGQYGLYMDSDYYKFRFTGGENYITGGTQAVYPGDSLQVDGSVMLFTGATAESARKADQYYGEKHLSVLSGRAVFDDAEIAGIPDQTYTGFPIEPELQISYNSQELVNGTDYTAVFTNNVNAGIATVTITGKGTYMGTKTETFNIVARSIGFANIAAIPVQTYTGSTLEPEPVITDGNVTLVKDTDYTLSYINNTEAGSGTVKITGQGNYKGTVSKKFQIHYATPVLSSVSSISNGVRVTWESVAGAAKYRVFRKSGSGGWTRIGEAKGVSFTDKTAAAGETYSYTVRCITEDGSAYTSAYDTTGKTITFTAAPVLSNVQSVYGGVKVTWKRPAGAVNYRVYRKVENRGWTKVGETTALSYTDDTAEAGTTYSYTVRCITEDGAGYASAYDTTGLTITYIAAPVLSNVQSINGGVKVTWKRSAGAVNYRVYRKTKIGGWTKIGETTAINYTDNTAEAGKTYSYTVRCINEDGSAYTSAYDTVGKTITYIALPVVLDTRSVNEGVKVIWKKSAGAENYRVYRKTGSGGWTKITETTALNYTDTTVAGGTTYAYTVRCITEDGSGYTSGYDTVGKTVTYVAPPIVTDVRSISGGVKITWQRSAGAENYRVYRKTGSSGWTKIAETTSTGYTDNTAVKGRTYAYTVRCITADGSAYTSGYDTVGKTITVQ